MSWYDKFIPPEIQAGRKAYSGDWEGALEAELGQGGTFFRKQDEGQQEQRQGFEDAIKSLTDLAQGQKQFQMQGLDKALGFYQPYEQRFNSIYGPPGSFRK